MMLKRWWIYLQEMFPIFNRLLVAAVITGEIYFIILLNYKITDFNFGIGELVAIWTVFSFLLFLRIADDLKDYQTDKKLFPTRPLPAGKIKRQDLKVLLVITTIITIILNLVFMNNWLFFGLLYLYGFLMSKWFFAKHKIQPNLPLALITHNPVQIWLNLYLISFVVIKYQLTPMVTTITIFTLLTLYFPALIWELARKIRLPKDETEYVTYSKLFGWQKMTKVVVGLSALDLITNIILVWSLSKVGVILLVVNFLILVMSAYLFVTQKTKRSILQIINTHIYAQEILMLIIIASVCFGWRI